MPLKLRHVRMQKDDLAWEAADQNVDEWERSIHNAETYRVIARLILKYRPGEAIELHRPIRGGYNISFRLEFKDGTSALMRVPCKGIVKFPEGKVNYEVATMRYVAANTTIPVPFIHHHGTTAENPSGLGPFIIMDYVDHERTMSEALNDPPLAEGEPHSLDSRIEEPKLRLLYGQMANNLLQLTKLSFPRIGSLVQDAAGEISAVGRPLIQNMNSLVEFARLPPKLLPKQSYSTSREWYTAMADMHMLQAAFQRNDGLLDDADARDKFVARRLFQRFVASDKFEGHGYCDEGIAGPDFRLYSEDLRPSNVLIDKNLQVFSSDPPRWLLLKSPEEWAGGYVAWMEGCEPRFNTFLGVLEEGEGKMRAMVMSPAGGSTTPEQPLGGGVLLLSQQMRQKWDSKSWLFNYAARNSWGFDFIYWRFLDMGMYGPNEDGDYRARRELLGERELEAMDRFVGLKMEHLKTRELVVAENRDDAVVALMPTFMV